MSVFKYLLFLLTISTQLVAQQNMKVIRSQVVPWSSPVTNIFVDPANNNKWVAHKRELSKVYALSLAAQVNMEPGEQSLAFYKGGNKHLTWQESDLRNAVGDIFDEDNYVSAGYYHEERDELWLGTTQTGIFKFKTKPSLQLIEQLTSSNSKLRSNQINDMAMDTRGRFWIATDDGAIIIEGGRWELIEKGLLIEAIAVQDNKIWMMGDGFVGPVNSRKTWVILDIPGQNIEGEIKDIAIDIYGQIWIASEIITRYNETEETYTVFGPAQEYTSQFATAIVADQEGTVWVGTRDKGLYVIQEGDAFVAACLIDKPLDCNGNGKDAALNVEVSGGTPPYQYAWTGGLNGAKPTEVAAGSYEVTVTDSKGNQAESFVTLLDLSVKATVKMDKTADNGAANGAATVTVEGGQPPYQYQWDNGASTNTVSNLSPGEHSVTIADKANCQTVANVRITEDAAALIFEANLVQPDCAEDPSASINLVVSGGTPPYAYTWDQEGLEGASVNGLSPGVYQVVISDAANQKKTYLARIIGPEPIELRALVESPASTGNNDGQASVQANGGAAPYTYQWDNGETTALAKRLSPGEHTVTITDQKGCTATATVTITEDILPLQLSFEQIKGIDCQGEKDATLKVVPRGGKAPFTYAWEGLETTAQEASGLSAGTYVVLVTDASGQQTTGEGNVTEPERLEIVAVQENPANTGQNDGRAIVNIQGGTGPFKYRWDNQITEANNRTLSPGLHNVTVEDANACTAITSVEIGEEIQPLNLELTTEKALSCHDDNTAILKAEVRGGKLPYTYRWVGVEAADATAVNLGAGNYKVIVQDASGLEKEAAINLTAPAELKAVVSLTSPASTGNADGEAMVDVSGGTAPYTYAWSSGANGEIAKGLAPGTQTITITDANACTVTGQVEVSENILPLQLSLEEVEPVRCKDGNEGYLKAVVRGGKPPYAYGWSHNSLNSPDAKELIAGEYSLTVTDIQETQQVFSYNLQEPDKLKVTATVVAPASTGNADGKAKVEASGGTGAYVYEWQNGSTGAIAENLAPGFHRILVKDERGCEASVTFEVSENILPLEMSLANTQSLSCAGQNDASIVAEVSGGKPPYNFAWNQSRLSGDQLTQLGPGTYELTLTDALGTSKTASIEIPALESLSVAITDNKPAMSDTSEDGKATASVSGGTPPYQYQWDDGATSVSVENLSIGQHAVTITDANGCTATANFETAERIMKELASGALRSGQTINMQKLQFDADSTKIREDARPILDEVYQFLKENPAIVVEIGGHTNNLPPPAYCDSLSTARAKAVAEYIVLQGIDSKRVYYQGYGKRKPLFTNKTVDGRRRNQRVEIKILRL
ncbi:MAG: OmpA family protein [Chitinophagales bacterium]|nr:OmpA family protein [Chitinophagales bacterium]